MDIEGLVKNFLEEENMPLEKLLVYASLGLSEASSYINSVTKGVVFNGHPYTDERKTKVEEALGEMCFYWLIIASTCDASPQDIAQKFVNLYLVKGNKISKEVHASILEMMKHVKIRDKETEKKKSEAKFKKRIAEQIIEEQTKL